MGCNVNKRLCKLLCLGSQLISGPPFSWGRTLAHNVKRLRTKRPAAFSSGITFSSQDAYTQVNSSALFFGARSVSRHQISFFLLKCTSLPLQDVNFLPITLTRFHHEMGYHGHKSEDLPHHCSSCNFHFLLLPPRALVFIMLPPTTLDGQASPYLPPSPLWLLLPSSKPHLEALLWTQFECFSLCPSPPSSFCFPFFPPPPPQLLPVVLKRESRDLNIASNHSTVFICLSVWVQVHWWLQTPSFWHGCLDLNSGPHGCTTRVLNPRAISLDPQSLYCCWVVSPTALSSVLSDTWKVYLHLFSDCISSFFYKIKLLEIRAFPVVVYSSHMVPRYWLAFNKCSVSAGWKEEWV